MSLVQLMPTASSSAPAGLLEKLRSVCIKPQHRVVQPSETAGLQLGQTHSGSKGQAHAGLAHVHAMRLGLLVHHVHTFPLPRRDCQDPAIVLGHWQRRGLQATCDSRISPSIPILQGPPPCKKQQLKSVQNHDPVQAAKLPQATEVGAQTQLVPEVGGAHQYVHEWLFAWSLKGTCSLETSPSWRATHDCPERQQVLRQSAPSGHTRQGTASQIHLRRGQRG